MCLLVAAFDHDPDFRLVLVGHRDEFHARPAAPLAWWPAPDGILAGRDLQAGGTWLGVSRDGRLGVVTNFRGPGARCPGGPSRGGLIPAFLTGRRPASAYAGAVLEEAGRYSGFTLLLLDQEGLTWVANRPQPELGRLDAGLYGLSNQRIDEPWPKLLRARARVASVLRAPGWSMDGLFRALKDREPAPDGQLPDTGIGLERERLVSAPFIVDPEYGTRCATVVLVGHDGLIRIEERRYDAGGEATGRTAFAFRESPPGPGRG